MDLTRRLLIAFAMVLSVCFAARAWSYGNYPPDNVNVQLTSTNLPIVWIDVDGQIIDRDERITARMKIIHNGDGQLNWADTLAHTGQTIDYEGYVALRYRGSSSYTMSDKKPYSFRPLTAPLEDGGTKKKVKILGMGKDNNWALLAPYADKSMMRDLLAFAVSRPWMEYTPQGRYCELFLDGVYYGVFILTEVVSNGKHRLNLPDPGDSGDDLTGGYIMEVNRVEDEVTYTSRYHPVNSTGTRYMDEYIHMQYKSPDYEDMTEEQVNYITGRIDQMEQALWSYKAGQTSTYGEYLDVTNFIDYQIAMELGHNVDGYRLSGKFFKRRDSEDPRFKMVVWDMNLAYGNADYYLGWLTGTWVYQNNGILYNAGDPQMVPFWWYKLNTDPDYIAALHSRWAKYRRTNLRQDHLMATIDSLAHVLTMNGAEARNSQAWPRWGVYVWPNRYVASDFNDEVAYLKQWLTDRISWMDGKFGFDPDVALRGDVNDDGQVDVSDVTLLIACVLNSGETDLNVADCNSDGQVDVADVTALINYILTDVWLTE